MRLREVIVEYSKGNDLRGFWLLFRLRENARSPLARAVLTFCVNRCANRHGGYIGPGAVLRGTPTLPHGLQGIFISRYATLGARCRVYQNVTIGEVDGQAPAIGDGCLVGAGAVLVGGIKIGSGAKIGAGAVVFADVPAGATVVAPAPRILRKEAAL